uniref:Uncharacterized protein n=1 Tax=Strombidium inclinatum TaxID=197538 RepID=A0A7S3IFZ5_9SPIT|mmetsp:Transcript_15002/g.23233  ORF Transcript_15002/g.23233 Transcript_15002/m.23233 type:complete len:164 (+) Transcript_15002:3439-3930(+)
MAVRLNPITSDLADLPCCTYCGHKIGIPNLKIIHGRSSRTFRYERAPRHKFIKVRFLSAQQIYNKVEKVIKTKRGKLMQIDVENFRNHHTELFWNVVYYFSFHDLPFDFVLPYKDTKEITEIEKNFNQVNQHCQVIIGADSNVMKMKDAAEKTRMSTMKSEMV